MHVSRGGASTGLQGDAVCRRQADAGRGVPPQLLLPSLLGRQLAGPATTPVVHQLIGHLSTVLDLLSLMQLPSALFPASAPAATAIPPAATTIAPAALSLPATTAVTAPTLPLPAQALAPSPVAPSTLALCQPPAPAGKAGPRLWRPALPGEARWGPQGLHGRGAWLCPSYPLTASRWGRSSAVLPIKPATSLPACHGAGL